MTRNATQEQAADLVRYLTETLIPDLRESGSEATADDFAECVEIIEAQAAELRARS